jgi:hypothetical protein
MFEINNDDKKPVREMKGNMNKWTNKKKIKALGKGYL